MTPRQEMRFGIWFAQLLDERRGEMDALTETLLELFIGRDATNVVRAGELLRPRYGLHIN
jgi:hypothetical protein